MKRFVFWLSVFALVGVYVGVSAQTLASPTPQSEEKAAAFYKGKALEFIVPYSPGGGYDTWARIVSSALAKHTGTKVIVRNMPGAGGKVAANRLQKESDGLSIFTSNVPGQALPQVYKMQGVHYDLTQFNWIGRLTKLRYPVCVGAKSGYKTLQDVQRAKEVKFALMHMASMMGMRAAVSGQLLGINFKMVTGYRGSATMVLAVQRGEVDAMSAPLTSVLPYIKSGVLIPLFVTGYTRLKQLPDVPTIFELKKFSAKEKRLADILNAYDTTGRPVATTPGVPKERVVFLEAALKKALMEPEVKEMAKKLGSFIDYASGREMTEAVNQMIGVSEDIKALLGKLLKIKGY